MYNIKLYTFIYKFINKIYYLEIARLYTPLYLYTHVITILLTY